MKVICEKCAADYDIEDQRIPPEGLAMKCPKCLGSIRVQRPPSGGAHPRVRSSASDAAAPGAELENLKLFVRRHTGSVFGPFGLQAIRVMLKERKLDGSESVSPDNAIWTRLSDHPAFQGLLGEAPPGPPRSTAADPPDLPELPVPKTQTGRPAAGPPRPPGVEDLPAPKGAAPRPALVPPPSPGVEDLPAPRTQTGRPAAGPPRPPGVEDLPAPKGAAPRSALVPPPAPGVEDLPAPKGAALRSALVPPPAPGVMDLPAPKGAAPRSALVPPPAPGVEDLPTPKAASRAAEGPLELPDLPTPKAASRAAEGPLELPDLPTPLRSGATSAPLELDELSLDLPEPRRPAATDAKPTSTTPPEWGEVDLPVDRQGPEPLRDDGPALDLSELDLVAPKAGAPVAARPASRTDHPVLAELAGVAPGVPEPEPAGSEPAARPTRADGPRLLGLPRRIALLGLGGLGVVALVIAVLLLRPGDRGKPTRRDPATPSPMGSSDPDPAPGPVKLTYVPAMDLDTAAGYEAAEKAYAKLQQRQPELASLRAARAKALLFAAYRYRLADRRRQAGPLLEGALVDTDAEAGKAEAARALAKGSWKAARERLTALRAQAKEDPEVHVLLGHLALEEQQVEAAEKSFRTALKLRAESAAAAFGLARSLLARPEPQAGDETAKLLDKALELSPRHVEAAVLRALLPGRAADAGVRELKALAEAAGAAPLVRREQAVLHAGLAELQARVGQWDAALAASTRATGDATDDPEIQTAHAAILEALGDVEVAAEQYAAAFKRAPLRGETLLGLVRTRLALGQPEAVDTALRDLEAAAKQAKVKGTAPHVHVARGLLAAHRQDGAAAKAAFLESTKGQPRFTAGHEAYLRTLLDSGQLEGMSQALEFVRRAYPAALPPGLQLLEARLQIALGKAEAGEKLLRAAQTAAPGDLTIVVALAEVLLGPLRRPDEGLLLLQQVHGRARAAASVARLLAEAHLGMRATKEALQVYADALAAHRSAAISRRYAELLARVPDPERIKQADALVRPLVEKAPRDAESLAVLAEVELASGKLKEAVQLIRKALLLRPTSRTFQLVQARIASAGGEVRKAEASYQELLKAQPKDTQVLLLLGQLLCRNRDPRGCLRTAKTLLAVDPAAEAHLLEGQAYLLLRQPAQALRSFDRALAREARHPHALFLKGRTYYEDADHARAITTLVSCLDQAEETAPWWSDAHYFLGMSYHQLGRAAQAQASLKKYLATPGNRENPETGIQRRTAEDVLKKSR
jgi:predicted Zn finger-like uncharacterized protein